MKAKKPVDKSDKLAVIKGRGAEIAHQEFNLSQQKTQTIEAGMRLGAAGALLTVSQKLNAEFIHMLEQFAETKGHNALGFSNFDSFLDESPYSPMTSNQYRDRKALLEREGDSTFDLLNSLKVPASTRKALPEGVVKIEGDVIAIADERIQMTDRERVKELIRDLAKRNSQQSTKLNKGQKDFEKLQKELTQLKANPAALSLSSTPHNQALTLAVAALGGLAIEVGKLPAEEAAQIRDEAMRLLSAQWANLQYAYGFEERPTGQVKSSFLSQQELEEIGDDF